MFMLFLNLNTNISLEYKYNYCHIEKSFNLQKIFSCFSGNLPLSIIFLHLDNRKFKIFRYLIFVLRKNNIYCCLSTGLSIHSLYIIAYSYASPKV